MHTSNASRIGIATSVTATPTTPKTNSPTSANH